MAFHWFLALNGGVSEVIPWQQSDLQLLAKTSLELRICGQVYIYLQIRDSTEGCCKNYRNKELHVLQWRIFTRHRHISNAGLSPPQSVYHKGL